MKVITYLGFTILSIFIQFCVMDFIQEKLRADETPVDMNITYKKKVVDDLLRNISSKPHALFYRTHMSSHRPVKRAPASTRFSSRIYKNTTEVPLGTTDVSTTIFDILYEENTSTIEPSTTTETFTTTDYDNITEITYLETTNKSTTVPSTVSKVSLKKYCGCNLLYKVCDIYCCCDPDCSSEERKHFQCEERVANNFNNDGCISHLLEGDINYGHSMANSVFCVVKTNLPDKRNIRQLNLESIGPYNKWKSLMKEETLFPFKKALYNHSDPIWILKDGTIYYLDFPTPMVNSYCTDRAAIKFLKEENIECIVRLKDLEMFHVSRTIEESMIISATESTLNSSVLNCSSLHCINWTVLACENDICKNYNSSLNEASCTDSVCINIALKIDYHFYYNDFKITNATVKLHIRNISNVIPFMSQEITVKFIMANTSLDSIIQFSGNPGYIKHLPVVVSYAKINFTDIFFNSTTEKSYLYYPANEYGTCTLTKSPHNVVRFGVNKRTKCRYVHAHRYIVTQNSTNICKSIQDNISQFLGLSADVVISPFGNPYGITDENWIRLHTEANEGKLVYGAFSENESKLHCYNLINRVSFIFIFASVDEKDFVDQNKILLTKYETVANNISFNVDDVTTVLTFDINFVDATKPNVYVYAGSPHINIHLPKDFFFPFPPNNCLHASNSCIITFFCYVTIFFANKITLE